MPEPLPVLWLCGPAGVGKSTVGWDLFAGLPGAAYVDIDQLGMCYPATAADPARTVLEARILGQVVANVRAAGAGCLIVSGYIDSRRGIHTEYLTDAALSPLRLRCDRPQLRRRLAGRGYPASGERELALSDAEVLDRSGLPYPCLDTTALTAAEVLASVRARWPVHPARPPAPLATPAHPPGEVVWVCGTTAVGKSSVGFEVALSSWRAGHATGFVDLQQIGFHHPAPGADPGRLGAANLAAVWQNFHAYGARRLVVVGEHHAGALPVATVTRYRLHASPDQLRERIRRRGRGEGPGIAGDGLRGQPAAVLDLAHEAAVARAEALEHAGIGDVRIDTDGRTVDDLAREIVTRSGW